jgi:hypothetical protein
MAEEKPHCIEIVRVLDTIDLKTVLRVPYPNNGLC